MVVTGVAEPRIIIDLIRRGVSDVTIKPINYRAFAAKALGYLECRQTGQSKGGAQPAAAAVSAQIDGAASQLKERLADITQSFQETITNLEKQQETIEAGYIGSLRVLTNLMNQVEHATGSHAGRVERMAVCLGEKRELSREQSRSLRVASLLHEIGMFGMPDSVRNTPPWQLSTEDRKHYESYPLIGAALLSEIPGAEQAADLVEQHAEHFDGTGFPRQRAGEKIPLGARILRVADEYDTFCMYAGAEHAAEEAIRHLQRQRGKTLDPKLVALAIEYLEEEAAKAPEVDEVKVVPGGQLRQGQVLAENAYDEDGHFLAREGALLSETLARRLGSLLGARKIRVRQPNPASSGEDA
jgi:response regulator RpfG family c-di-GMP phosphodiesterase